MNQRLSRLLFLVLTVLAGTAVLSAQSSVSKQINAVKLSGECFFAESTEPLEAEAKANATTFLANYINAYLKDNSLTVPPVTEDKIPGIKYFTMDRSGNKRVFAYVEKAVILDGAKPDSSPTKTAPAPASTKEPAPTTTPAKSPAPTPAPVTTPAVSTSSDTNQGEREAMAELLYDALFGDEDDNQSDDRSSADPLIKMLTSLEKSEDIKSAWLSLQRLNAEYMVKRYGPLSKCRNKMYSAWMIFSPDGKKLIGFLTPGKEGERIDMMNGNENASLDDFLGNGNTAIFFELR